MCSHALVLLGRLIHEDVEGLFLRRSQDRARDAECKGRGKKSSGDPVQVTEGSVTKGSSEDRGAGDPSSHGLTESPYMNRKPFREHPEKERPSQSLLMTADCYGQFPSEDSRNLHECMLNVGRLHPNATCSQTQNSFTEGIL